MLRKILIFFIHHVPSFTYLNLTQFFGALNDNIYKLLLVYYLIQLEGAEDSSFILATTGAIFVLPFLLFSSIAGGIADRFSKSKIIFLSKNLEVITMTLGLIAFYFKLTISSYLILFLMAAQSSLFSPSKYGIVPEIVKNDKISISNGLMSAFTYLAIILGTFLATFLTQITNYNFVLSATVCIIIALLGLITSSFIQPTVPANQEKKISFGIVLEIYRTLNLIKKEVPPYKVLLSAISGSAYFLFLGAFLQLNLIPYTIRVMHLTDLEGGYLFLGTALGIGVGSYLSGIVSGKGIELGLSPIAGIFLGVGFISLDIFSSHPPIIISLVIMLGLAGGLFLVPLDTTIQVLSPVHFRGQVVATTNFLGFLGVMVASGFIYFNHLIGFKPDTGFTIVGLTTLFYVIFLSYQLFDHIKQFIRKLW